MTNIHQDYLLKQHHTFGMDISAKQLAIITSETDLQYILERKRPPFLILGGGSNVLFTKDVEQLVLLNKIMGKRIVFQDEERVLVAVGAGENWHEFVLWTLENEWSGVENLSLIPGTVGASPIQNIGAYGVELKDFFESLEAINLQTGEIEIFEKEDCHFAYRDSIFKRAAKGQFFITRVYLSLSKVPKINIKYGAIQQVLDDKKIELPSPKDVSDAVIAIRQSKLPDPAELGNAGSFFKNPTIGKTQFEELQKRFPEVVFYALSEEQFKIPAGWLIEQCGWKGKRIGETGAHAKQALVLVNYGAAKGLEIKDLSEKIMASVYDKYGIQLEREVNVI